jgi:hypothetical protein
MQNKEWKLQDLRIDFKTGYEWQKTVDRYEGRITFSNKEGESFTFNVDQFQAQKFLDIVGAEIVKTASTLGQKVAESINIKGNKVEDIIRAANKIAELEKWDEVDPIDLEHHELGGEGGEE